MGITTMPVTAAEFLRMHNGKRKQSAKGSADMAYLEGS